MINGMMCVGYDLGIQINTFLSVLWIAHRNFQVCIFYHNFDWIGQTRSYLIINRDLRSAIKVLHIHILRFLNSFAALAGIAPSVTISFCMS